MKQSRYAIYILVMVALLSTVGCSSNAKSYLAEEQAYEKSAAYDYGAGEVLYAAETEAVSADMARSMSGGMSDSATSAAPQPENTLPEGRKLITEMNISMETTEIDVTVATISNAVKRLGGYIQSSSISGNSLHSYQSPRYANMTLRVPQKYLDEFLTTAESTGNISHRSENLTDITLQYFDMEDRINTLKIEQDRLWELLAKAESIESIIALEQRLSEIRYELQSYNSQLRIYDNQVDYATIYLDLREVEIYTPQSKDSVGQRISKGFRENVAFITDSLVNSLVFVIAHLPVLVILAAIVFVIAKIVKRGSIKRISRKQGNADVISQNSKDGE